MYKNFIYIASFKKSALTGIEKQNQRDTHVRTAKKDM